MINISKLIINKKPEDCTVVVGMSGGVDSSVVAALLKKSGYNVIGVTLQLWSPESLGFYKDSSGSMCGSKHDIEDAKKVCYKLKIQHIVRNYESDFKEKVVDDFIQTYASGCTPIPCIKCNSKIKFSSLIEIAKELNADAIATGHYVQKEFDEKSQKFKMLTAVEENKDQSYFLFSTTQEQLDYTIYPLGAVVNKEETRTLAKELGLHISDKKDSQDICFIPDGNYRDLINSQKPEVNVEGDFIDSSGKKIGTHKGIINYTVGQRKNLGINLGFPAYVLKIDTLKNQVTIGTREELRIQNFYINELNWLGENIPEDGIECNVKVRSTHKPVPCILKLESNNCAKVELYNPEAMVAPGQAAVFYYKRRMIGGGWILNNTERVTVKIN